MRVEDAEEKKLLKFTDFRLSLFKAGNSSLNMRYESLERLSK